MINAVITFLVVIPAGMICMFPMKNQLRYGLRRSLLTFVGVFAALIPIISWLAVRFSINQNTLLFPALIIFFVAYHSSLRVHISKSLAVFFLVMSLMGILSIFATRYDALQNPQLGADSYTGESGLFHFAMSTAAMLLLIYPYCKYGSRLIDSLDLPQVWYSTLFISSSLLAITLFMRPIKYESLNVNRISEAVLKILITLLLLWCLINLFYYFIITGMLHAAQISEEKWILEMQESQFVSQQRYIEATAQERHDLRQSIRTMVELYHEGNIQALGEYLDQYETEMPKNDIILYTKNHALNALLNHYANIARFEQIDLQIEANIPESLSVSDVDLCRITGNLLENAITACQKVPEKWIRISFTIMNGCVLYIIVANSFNGKVRLRDDRYLSTSRNSDGNGLASIESIAERYNGYTRFYHEGSQFFSNVAIPL